MKKVLLTIVVCFSVFVLHAKGTDKMEGESEKTARTVLVVGFEKENLQSNYYNPSQIAEKTGIKEDSLHYQFSEAIIKHLHQHSNFRLVEVEDYGNMSDFYRQVNYTRDDNEVYVDLSSYDQGQYQKLLKKYDANYFLFINSYKLSWKGEPFNTVFHIMNYSVFNNEKEKMYEGVAYFDAAGLTSLDELDKKYDKEARQIASRVKRSIK
ncbi:MAG: hypothetical protein GVY19_05665 [Bacteroidetes bacterium]|jgi:hypothetical protein|nr:hypothetical protein [Bacteroidota bacterium]